MGKPYDGTGGWRIAAPIGAWEPPLAEYVAKYVADDRTGHDFYHCLRVRALAVRIADGEALDPEVMVAAAYLHDIGRDQERSGAGDHVAIGEAEAAKILPTLGFPASKLAAVAQCIHYHEEYDWVRDGRARECSGVREIAGFQDADRLDAIGAIGLARMFMFGGAYDRPLWIPNVAPGTWRHGELGAATYNHLYEKLLKLKEKMNTTTGRRLAESRHRFMKSYARRFEREWEGLL